MWFPKLKMIKIIISPTSSLTPCYSTQVYLFSTHVYLFSILKTALNRVKYIWKILKKDTKEDKCVADGTPDTTCNCTQ